MVRERIINGPIIIIVFTLGLWAGFGVYLAAQAVLRHHVHTVDCWDE